MRTEIGEMLGFGLSPTLILLPISWRLREALGLHPIAPTPDLKEHPLVPLSAQREFAGIFDDIPVLETSHVASDQLWILDLPRAASFVEWPSESDLGISIELREFSEAGAKEFLAENPKWSKQMDFDESLDWLQEHVLLTMRLHWSIESLDTAGAAATLRVPDSLAFRS